MINYFILALSTLSATGKALFCKAIGGGKRSEKQAMLLNCKSFFAAFICSLLFVLKDIGALFHVSAFTLILSLFFGFSVAATQILQAKAMGRGPASMVSLVYSCGFLVPILYGLAFWNEEVSLLKWIGVGLLILTLFLILDKRGEKCPAARWLPFAVLAMLGSGANAIFQKTHQYSDVSEELPFFLTYSLFFSAVFTCIAYACLRKEKKEYSAKWRAAEQIWIPICLGVCVSLLNFLNLHLSGKLPSVIHFPVYNVGSLLLTTAISALIYRDIPTKRQAIGFAVGILAILIVGLL